MFIDNNYVAQQHIEKNTHATASEFERLLRQKRKKKLSKSIEPRTMLIQ